MTWALRSEPAFEHEERVASVLRARGWLVEPFGQAQISEAIRVALRRNRHLPLRWMPDLLCIKGERVLLVDAKTCLPKNKASRNHALECDAYDAHCRWQYAMRTEFRYVWHDLHWSQLAHIMAGIHDGTVRRAATHDGSGSGTPFYLIPRVEPFTSALPLAKAA